MNTTAGKSTFELLNADYIELDKSWNYKNITSTFYRLYFIEDGLATLHNGTDNVVLEKGYLYLIPSFTYFNTSCSRYLKQYYLHFIEESANGSSLFVGNRTLLKIPAQADDEALIKRIIELNPDRGLRRSHNPNAYEKRPVLQSFTALNNATQLSAYLETQGIILQLLSRFLVPGCFKLNQHKAIPSKILDAINFIQTNLQTHITVEQLAGRANLNADYFSRLFNENTGERPLVYIRHKKIERAQVLLATTDLSFGDIAAATGFESAAYFSRTFKQITGLSPGSYKRNNQLI